MWAPECRQALRSFAIPYWILRHSDLQVTYNPYSEDDARRLGAKPNRVPEKASADLGFTYKYDLRTGLQRLIDWRDKNVIPRIFFFLLKFTFPNVWNSRSG